MNLKSIERVEHLADRVAVYSPSRTSRVVFRKDVRAGVGYVVCEYRGTDAMGRESWVELKRWQMSLKDQTTYQVEICLSVLHEFIFELFSEVT